MLKKTYIRANIFTLLLIVSVSFLSCGKGAEILLSGDEKSISSFILPSVNATGVINKETINIIVPFGTDTSLLIPEIVYSGVSIAPANGLAADFSAGPVIYTVTAENESTRDYTVTVDNAQSGSKNILTFNLLASENAVLSTNAIGTVTTSTVNVFVPYGTNVSALMPDITISGTSISPADGAVVDFSGGPVTYTVTAADLTTKTYTITIMGAWNNYKDITINAQSLGLSANVTNFPLLIRLDTANFPDIATKTKSGGADIRFAKTDESPLPYEIENWVDNTSGTVWVLVDTISKSSATTIRMYYNQSSAVSESNPETVFNTTNGFQGVWHLGETSGSVLYDSTSNGFDGTHMGSPASQTGIMGKAQYFSGGVTNYIDTGKVASELGVGGSNPKTVSVWVNTANMGNRWGIFDFGANSTNQQYGMRVFSTDIWRCQFWGGDIDFIFTSLNTWVNFSLIYDGTTARIYANGVLQNSGAVELNTADTNSVKIGVYIQGATFYTFMGIIDEIRISNSARSEDWTRLDYESQKASQTLVVF